MAFVLSFACAQVGRAQEPAGNDGLKLEFNVRVKGLGKPLPRAEVRFERDVFFTDEAGKAILVLAERKGKIAVTHQNYETLYLNLEELDPKQTSFDIFLFPGTPNDNEILVRGMKRATVSKKSVSSNESARVSAIGDPVQVTKLLPGVQSQAFSTDIAVRGSSPEDSIYYVDTFQVNNIFHGIGNLSIMPEPLISDVEFSAGGFGPEYGDAHGGVVVIRTKNEIPEAPKTEFRVNIPFFSTVFHERPLAEDKSLAVSVRRSYLELFLPYVVGKDSGLYIVPYFMDGHIVYLQKTPDGGHWKTLTMATSDGLKLAFDYEEADEDSGQGDVKLRSDFYTLGVERLKPLGDGWSYTLAPQMSYQRERNYFFSDRVSWDLYWGKMWFEFNKRISKKENFYFGVEPQYAQVNLDILAPVRSDDPLYDYEDAPRETLEKTYVYQFLSTWIAMDKQLGDFVVTPGARFIYSDLVNHPTVDPRLNVRYEINEQQAIKAAWGQYSVNPGAEESDKTFGNPDLEFATSYHYVLGLESKWTEFWETDVQAYYKRTVKIVEPHLEKNYDNTGSARSYGGEFFVRRNLTERSFGWLSYSYSKSQSRPNDEEEFKDSVYDQTHVATFAGSYRIVANWDLGTRISYHTGDTYTPISDSVYNANLDKYQPRIPERDENSKRLPDFHQIDVFASWDHLYDTWKLGVRFGFQYLALSKQVFAKRHNYDYSEEENINDIPPIPFVEVRGVL